MKSQHQINIGRGMRRIVARRQAGEGFIYAAQLNEIELVKIGHSLFPERRVLRLNITRGPTYTARVLAKVPGTIWEEHELHKQLRAYRALGREYYPRSILTHAAIPAELRSVA